MHFPWFHITTLTPWVSIAYGLFGIRCTARQPAASRFCRHDYSKDRISFRHSGEHEAPAESTTTSSQQVLKQQTQCITTAQRNKQAAAWRLFPVCIKRVRQGESKTRTVGDANNNSVGKGVQCWECLHRQRPRQRRRRWRR